MRTGTDDAAIEDETEEAPKTTSTEAPATTMTAATTATTTATVGTTSGGSDETAIRVKQAVMQGYVGESCTECGNFTLVRNGTCLKCNTCGATTGCS